MRNFIEVSLLPEVDEEGEIFEPLRITILVEDIQIIFEQSNGLCALELFRKNTGQGELLQLSTHYSQVIREIGNFEEVELL